eukprot:g461.t1
MLIQLLISLLLPLVTLGEAVYTAPPLIGVFSHPLGSSSQYIAKSYISWINSGGGRAVPISYYATAEEITTLYGTLNGFLFPGGSAALPESARFLYAKLTSTNDVEDPQQKPVLWGTCLGFEWISLLAGAPTLDSFQAENISLPLQFEQSAFTSRLFTNDDKSDNKKIQNIFANQNVTMNNHHKGIAPSRFQNTSTSLNTSYRLLSISYDKMGQSFVSSMEHMDLPIYGVQFHPEKNNFEYGVAVPAKRARTTAAVGGKISEIHNKALGKELLAAVRKTRVLVVGAGGIGCELLKTLVQTGFHHIEVIDLDTIEVSNLNRQFLFRSHHVKQSKAAVACETVASKHFGYHPTKEDNFIAPPKAIIPHHGNVKTGQFNSDFFQTFDFVINALDNASARSHVNRVCLSQGIPLIDAGTTGHLGQASVYLGKETQCWDCLSRPAPKTYPICTLRSTPSKPVHTIVWGKEFFKLLFGTSKDSMLWEPLDGPVNDDEEGKSQDATIEASDATGPVSTSAFMNEVERAKPKENASISDILTYAQGVFTGIYENEIKKKLRMRGYKGAKHRPSPLSLNDSILFDTKKFSDPETVLKISAQLSSRSIQQQHRVWTLEESIVMFLGSIIRFWTERTSTVRRGEGSFEKDDPLHLDWITAASNLRSHIFQIPLQTAYRVKEVAGNIIPAVATSNAIVSGVEVLQALQLVRIKMREGSFKPGAKHVLKECTNCQIMLRDIVLTSERLPTPNPQCWVCNRSIIKVAI